MMNATMIEPRCLIMRYPNKSRFQAGFVLAGKWFRRQLLGCPTDRRACSVMVGWQVEHECSEIEAFSRSSAKRRRSENQRSGHHSQDGLFRCRRISLPGLIQIKQWTGIDA
jgi:hypothetical protein